MNMWDELFDLAFTRPSVPLMNVFVCDRLQQEREEDSGSDEEFDGGLVVPGKIWKKLYK